MSKQLYDDQTLTQYLLGSLSEAETERLDELSVTDDEVAEALRFAEQDLVDAYAQDELTEAARAQFINYYLASPLRREKVAFAQAFQAHAEKSPAPQASSARVEAAAEVAPKRQDQSWFSTWRGFNISRPAWAWGAAVAALALLVTGSWLMFERVRPRQQMAQTQRDAPDQRGQESQKGTESQTPAPAQSAEESARAEREHLLAQEQAQREQQRTAVEQRTVEQQRAASRRQSPSGASRIASFVLTPQMRGAGTTQTISFPSQTAYVAMRLNLEPNEFSTYRVALLDETGSQTLWRSSQIKARASGGGQVLNLSFRARLLKPQARYVLRVTGGATEIVDDYPFRVK
jgi:hypothetical protein